MAISGVSSTPAADWLHWRGPNQTGISLEKNLPDDWDPKTPGRNNLLWKAPYGCRSTPLIMNGKVYITSSLNDTPKPPTAAQRQIMGEQVICLDAKTGKMVWEKKYNVFHTDIVANRLGWSPLAADPENKLVFVHLTGGQLIAFDALTGKEVWEHSMTEEYGRVTGYGGRIGGGPIFDSGLVIVGVVQASWGNYGPGANRWVAFDAKTGKIAWWSEAPEPIRGTYYSNPVVAVIKGERLMITGGADGGVHAFQVRTGKRVWSYTIARGVINPSPVVNGDYVYISHGEENPEGGTAGLGRVVCLDAGNIRAGKPDLVWDFRKGIRFGLASLAFADGLLYVPDDGAKLYCFDGKTGKNLWKYSYGTVSRGAPLIADGKMYLSETNFKFHIIKLKGKDAPEEDETHTVAFKNQPGAEGFVEVNSTPSVADGRVYLATRDEIYCITNLDAKSTERKELPPPKLAAETPAKADDAIAQIQIFPADLVAKPGDKVTFEVRAFNEKGALIPSAKLDGKWDLPIPPVPKGAKAAPPPLDGKLEEGSLTLGSKPAQQGYVSYKVGDIEARARVRVAPNTSYKQDFKMVPVGAVPAGWVNAQLKYSVQNIGGENVLFKKNDDPRPPIARAIAYITMPESKEYTIEAELKGIEKKDKLPDVGVVANRYVFYLDGKTDEKGEREARLISWEALPRINVGIPFTWKSDTWYRVKMTVTTEGKETFVRCKVWESGKEEPAKWSLEFKDPSPNLNGSAGLYSYITNAEPADPMNPMKPTGSEIHFRSVEIKPNQPK